MRKTVARCVFLVMAICSAILFSFPSFPSTLAILSKPQVVDRALKGDRLTIAPSPAKNGRTSRPAPFEQVNMCPWAAIALLARCRRRNFPRSLVAVLCNSPPRDLAHSRAVSAIQSL